MKNKNYTQRTLIKHSTEWNDRALAVAVHYGVGKSEAIRMGVDQLYEELTHPKVELTFDTSRDNLSRIQVILNESKNE